MVTVDAPRLGRREADIKNGCAVMRLSCQAWIRFRHDIQCHASRIWGAELTKSFSHSISVLKLPSGINGRQWPDSHPWLPIDGQLHMTTHSMWGRLGSISVYHDLHYEESCDPELILIVSGRNYSFILIVSDI